RSSWTRDRRSRKTWWSTPPALPPPRARRSSLRVSSLSLPLLCWYHDRRSRNGSTRGVVRQRPKSARWSHSWPDISRDAILSVCLPAGGATVFTRKRRAVWGVAAVCLSAVACASAPPASPDLAEAAAIERERFAALVRHEVEALQAMLADDLLYCHSSGLCDTKAQFIESIRSGRRHYVGIEVTDIRPRAIGD